MAFRTILIGAGKMGRNHLRVLSEDPRFSVVAVVDPRADQLFSSPPGFRTAASLQELGDLAWDCAVVAAPTVLHHGLVNEVLDRNKPLLIEKPLAATTSQCQELTEKAEALKIPVGVGHLERFNPAVRKLAEIVRSGWLGRPIHFSFTRVGGYPEGNQAGNSVLIDLAVHDLDVLQHLIGPVRVLSSVSHAAVQPGVFDTAEILLSAESGPSAAIHVNWVTPAKIRTLRVTGTRGVCFVDYVLQSCTLYGGNLLRRGVIPDYDFESLIQLYKSTDRIEFGVVKHEPLKTQLGEFYQLLSGQPSALCTFREAATALALAEEADRNAVRSEHKSTGSVPPEPADLRSHPPQGHL